MVDSLSSIVSEISQVLRNIGVQGTLGTTAQVKGMAGSWKDLIDDVNIMSGNLTGQVANHSVRPVCALPAQLQRIDRMRVRPLQILTM